MSDAAWTGLGVIFAGLFTFGATVLQAKFSADKAVKIALLEAEVVELKDTIVELKAKVEKLDACQAKVIALETVVAGLNGEVRSLKDYITLLEDRSRRDSDARNVQPPV